LCQSPNDKPFLNVLMLQQEAMGNRRVTRLGAIRTLMCLEAVEEGYSFVKRCTGCDYYLQNHQLNAIAIKKRHSDLSKYWQCTTPHTYSQLTSSDMNAPYQTVKPTKYYSYLVSDWRSNNDKSTMKRVRLFSPPSSENLCSSGTKSGCIGSPFPLPH
jgi:hypothetical protein